ncbi:hypothetical protein NCH02_004325 [Salmonella enterica]|nr:hypothetical protein [Salmonella enterica]EJH0393591.1 hypothetical protein [Salmonella enterica]
MANNVTETAVVGGVDTHKDLHVAAVVDQNNKNKEMINQRTILIIFITESAQT